LASHTGEFTSENIPSLKFLPPPLCDPEAAVVDVVGTAFAVAQIRQSRPIGAALPGMS
jgi:hypothetical protein